MWPNYGKDTYSKQQKQKTHLKFTEHWDYWCIFLMKTSYLKFYSEGKWPSYDRAM